MMKANESISGNCFKSWKKASIIPIICLFMLNSVTLQAQDKKTDFTGNWKLNETKSQMGEGRGRMAATKMKITQDATQLSNERTSVRPSGEEMTMTEKVTFDGKETDNSTNNRQRKSTASWSADGKTLTINSVTTFERDGNTMEIKATEIYKLGSDGTLTIESTSTSPRGEFKASLVYDKA